MPKVVFDTERCKGCNLCPRVCPVKIIKLSDGINKKGYHPAEVEEMDKCIGCGFCYEICPDTAVEVYKEEGGK